MPALTVTGRLERPPSRPRTVARDPEPGVEGVPNGPEAPPPKPTPIGTARVARQLALAYHVEALVDSGSVRDYAAVARALGLTRARLSQIVALRWLPVATQEAILSGASTASERQFRAAAGAPCKCTETEP